MENIILVIVLAAIIGLAAGYVVKAKKRGHKCIGCPEGCCSKNGGGSCCGCNHGD